MVTALGKTLSPGRSQTSSKGEATEDMPEIPQSRTDRMHIAVVQPSPFCNIDCKYCYLPNRSATDRMSPQILERTFQFLFQRPEWLADPFVTAWHGGEPLAVSMDFYDNAFSIMQRLMPLSVNIENWFQTNGTLINQDWCNFIKHWNIKVGVSVDGPPWIHDANRVDRSGQGTFAKVLRGLELLKSNHIEFATIGVLSETALDFPEQMWRFYKDLGVNSLAFNFEDIEGVHAASSLHSDSCFSRAQSFFEKLLQLRDQEGVGISIRELDYFLDGIPQWQHDFRRMENVPLSIVAIAWNGDVSTFSPELMGMKHARHGDFIFGNVVTSTLQSMLVDSKFQAVTREIEAGVQRCKAACEYYCVCGGGQPSNKLHENGAFDSDETLACRLRIKAVGNVALNYLEQKHGIMHKTAVGCSIRERVDQLIPLLGMTPFATGH